MRETASPEMAREALERVLESGTFARSARARELLSYLVTEELASRGDGLKGFTIAMDVFGRDETFDANADPLVRVQAGRLRGLLERYYESEGLTDATQIILKPGSYRPEFLLRALAQASTGQREANSEPLPASKSTGSAGKADQGAMVASRWRLPVFLALGILAGLVVLALLATLYGPYWNGTTNENLQTASDYPTLRVITDLDDPLLAETAERVTSALAKFDAVIVKAPEQVKGIEGAEQAGDEPGAVASAGSLDHAIMISRVSDPSDPGGWLFNASVTSLSDRRVLRTETYPSDIWDMPDVEVTKARILTGIGTAEGLIHADLVATGKASAAIECLDRINRYYVQGDRDHHGAAIACSRSIHEEGGHLGLITAHYGGLIAEAAVQGYAYEFLPADRGEILRLALQTALEGVDMAPVSARAAREVGYVHSRLQHTEEMESWFARAMTLNPLDTSVIASYGYSLVLLGRFDEAVEQFDLATAATRRHPAWWDFHHGLALLMTGNLERAQAAIVPLSASHRNLYYSILRAVLAQDSGNDYLAARTVRDIRDHYPAFAADPKGNFRERHYPPGLIDHLLASLHRSGL